MSDKQTEIMEEFAKSWQKGLDEFEEWSKNYRSPLTKLFEEDKNE
jgi:hypothetical protein